MSEPPLLHLPLSSHPRHTLLWRCCMALAWSGLWSAAVQAQDQAQVQVPAQVAAAELDFFEPVPVVLTATRLAQPLSDAPGAVTVLDRETIRRSGARTLADVLRLVPGYLVSGLSGANPVAAYHAPIDDWGVRNLVLVDGQSLYSSTYLGGTVRGMVSVALEDIERVEVLRGSNSAAYGANALFGVINVITRHALDTLGRSVSLTQGEAGIGDAHVRLGWGDATAAQRLSYLHRSDTGYAHVNDDTRLHALSWRGDFQWRPDLELSLQAKVAENVIGRGEPGRPGDPVRDEAWSSRSVSATLTHRLPEDEQIKWSFSWDEDRNRDSFPYLYHGIPLVVSANYDDRRTNLEYQHQKTWGPDLRAVWGVGWKEDTAVSSALFFTEERIGKRDLHGFGNAEWAFARDWLLNAGLYVGHDSTSGSYVTPRLMFNHRLAEDHTLRFGVAQAKRPPTLLEAKSNVRFDVPILRDFPLLESRLPLVAETLRTQEVGYYGRWSAVPMSLDVRLYQETFSDEIDAQAIAGSPIRGRQFENLAGFRVRGLEYQLKWEPVPGSQWLLNQSFNRLVRPPGGEFERRPPSQSTTLGWMQQLPQGWELALFLHTRTGMVWRAVGPLGNTQRLDLRLAKRLRWGGTRAEVAGVVQSLNGDRAEFTTQVPSQFTRRAMVSLKLEF